MSTISRTRVMAMATSVVVGVTAAGVLVITGGSPRNVLIDVIEMSDRQNLLSASAQFLTVLFAVAWFVVAGLFVHAVTGLLRLCGHLMRRIGQRADASSPHTWVGAIVILVVGVFSSLKLLGERAGANHTPHPPLSSHDESGTTSDSPSSMLGTRHTLPALASVGLAVGLTTHVRRSRAKLLADAPDDATLGRLSAPSLSMGVALFERAKLMPEPSSVVDGQRQPEEQDLSTAMVVPMGLDNDRLVSVTLHAGETLSVDAESDEALAVLRHVLNTVVLAPWLDQPTVILHGFPTEHLLITGHVEIANTHEDIHRLVAKARHLSVAKRVVVVARTYFPELDHIIDQGVLVISICAESRRPTTRVVRRSDGWHISSTGERFRPYGVSAVELGTLQTMTEEMLTVETDARMPSVSHIDWQMLLRVLGPVEPINRDHSEVVFRKAKSVELLCWLAFHRDRPTIAGARTALWEIDVRDATFHNVLSELRRGLASAGINNAVGRKTKHRLYLDEQIITDGDLLRAVLHSSERRAATVAVSELCGALGMVRGLPFTAANYAWADAEGITSTLYWLVTRSIERVAALVETDRDKSALFEAAAAGLRMSPGDEAFTHLQSHALVRS